MFDVVPTAFAQGIGSKLVNDNPAVRTLLDKINENIITPGLQVLFGLAFVVFVYGVIQMVMSKDDGDKREDAKRSILWGSVGMAVMVSVYGILNFIVDTLGVPNPLN